MTESDDGDAAIEPPPTAVDDTSVRITGRRAGFAYRAGEVLVRGERGRARARSLSPANEEVANEGVSREPATDERVDDDASVDGNDLGDELVWFRLTGVDRPLDLVDQLRAEGFDAQPNHVLFSHSCDNDCCPHPADLFDAVWCGGLANPVRSNPVRSNPVRSNPVRSNPVRSNPVRSNPVRSNSELHSSARPAAPPTADRVQLAGPGALPHIVILDTGLDIALDTARSGATITGEPDRPDQKIELGPAAGSVGPDGYLDPVAGHGTFIAGLIERHAPGCRIDVKSVVSPLGLVSESDAAKAVNAVIAAHDEAIGKGSTPPQVIVLMSFGGPADGTPNLLWTAISRAVRRGIVVVASAGNDSTCIPYYPAALPNVIGVAALDSVGPAPFTNFGDWVDACAPGTDLISWFFDGFDGARPMINTHDIDRFRGWASWSGTSFAAPLVIAAIAREIVLASPPNGEPSITARDAAERVIRAPHLLRLPRLGTVINI
jgi:hypothetical protein